MTPAPTVEAELATNWSDTMRFLREILQDNCLRVEGRLVVGDMETVNVGTALFAMAEAVNRVTHPGEIRAAALEEAAKVAEAAIQYGEGNEYVTIPSMIADSIRALSKQCGTP